MVFLEFIGQGIQINKLNDLILNLTPENMTQHSRREHGCLIKSHTVPHSMFQSVTGLFVAFRKFPTYSTNLHTPGHKSS